MTFQSEAEFEEALINQLTKKGWEKEVLKHPTEQDLINNWAKILFENNRTQDRLGDYPLTDSEMQQILEQIKELKTPLKLNGFINGKTVSIRRDNENDKAHFGKEISLKIYDRHEIAAGQSRYQIAQQPEFKRKSSILNNRRGDLMLLINGMPVIHIELKKSGIPVSQACNQIEKYSHEGIFTGLFSLIQIFVAMNPEETLYFANNPGADGKFNKSYYFHWADFNNVPIKEWQRIATTLLSIPMAHQMIGFYTVADDTDGVLKVMRSYQYYAANAISDKVAKTKWDKDNLLGGYVWHTTGSGKTMTSFKSAQLIASSKNADKVIFLMDRIELGVQSLMEYRGFADANQSVQATENTDVLISKLKSSDPANILIVTSIQKMSNIKDEGINSADIDLMNSKRIVFIIDECHRSTFGEMLTTIKNTFSHAIFFGFTGTPIFKENQKKLNETTDIFGNELHRYTIADGIGDKNVLGFDPYKEITYKDVDIREAIALEKSKSKTREEALQDKKKSEVYFKYMNDVPMAGYLDKNGEYISGIEDYLSNSQYNRIEHQSKVIDNILNNWVRLSRNGKFHAIFATHSIPEAIEYYRLFKKRNTDLKITAIFDTNIDNNGDSDLIKEDGLLEIIEDYNNTFNQKFSIPIFAKMKKDISRRLAHKKPYERITNDKTQQLDLLIVVDQMLTGFDSKWVNTLYLDKELRYENLIQAFSRTNRLFGPEKPFGTIKYYRKPHTMERNIKSAISTYSGDRPTALFVQHLKTNLEKMNSIFEDISRLFKGTANYEKLPTDKTERKKFASLFKEFNIYLEAAKIQGFKWDILEYKFESEIITVVIDELTYSILLQRYKELFSGSGEGGNNDVPYEIDGYLTEIDTGVIDADYMNSKFEKYYKDLQQDKIEPSKLEETLNDLHRSFAMLSQEEQNYATIFLHDVQCGNIKVEQGKTFRDYITEYICNAKNDQIHKMAASLGVDENKLRAIMADNVDKSNINEYNRFKELMDTLDKTLAKKYFEKTENTILKPFQVVIKADKVLREFILKGGFDINE